NTLPLRLFAKGNRKFWNPADIDFSVDARDWEKLTDRQRLSATYLCAQFAAGEEAVTEDIQPFLRAMAAEGRLGDEMYLAQFCFEEAKHTEAFRRWMDAVGLTDDLHPFVAENPHYRKLFYEELPESLGVLAEDPSPRNQVRASVTYNHVIEGSLALTGYYAWQKLCVSRGILPGMREARATCLGRRAQAHGVGDVHLPSPRGRRRLTVGGRTAAHGRAAATRPRHDRMGQPAVRRVLRRGQRRVRTLRGRSRPTQTERDRRCTGRERRRHRPRPLARTARGDLRRGG